MWLRILESEAQVRTLQDPFDGQASEVVIFTDGAFPDPRVREDPDCPYPAVGWLALVQGRGDRAPQAFFSSYAVPESTMAEWHARRTQACMIELFGAVLAIEAMGERIRGMRTLLLVDAEAVESALVKGYSSIEDVGDLVGLFWDLVLHLDLSCYIGRVPSDANPADAPSRGQCEELERRGAQWCTSSPSTRLLSRAAWLESLPAVA